MTDLCKICGSAICSCEQCGESRKILRADPRWAAYFAIDEVMAIGSAKDGCNDSWRTKILGYHLTKGIRHATTALMVKMGIIPPCGNNLKEAITRLAMALVQEEINGK